MTPANIGSGARRKTQFPGFSIRKICEKAAKVVALLTEMKMKVAARLRHIAETKWGTRRHLRMEALNKMDIDNQAIAQPRGHRQSESAKQY